MQDRDVQQYCQEISDDFVKEYSQMLDDTIRKMFQHFGYDNEMNTGEWLESKNFDLMLDEEYNSKEDKKTKTIFLVDKKDNDVIALFLVETIGGVQYRISDIFVRDLGDF